MLNRIIQFSLKNRLTVLLTAVLLIAGGAYTASKMEVDVFPDLNAPTVVVMTEAKGMAPEEVERLVTFPIETAVNGATDVRRVRSSSTTGFSVVWVEFDWGTDIYRARQIVSEKLAAIGESLPDGVGMPTLGPQSSILGEMMFVAMTADSTTLQQLRTLADWQVRPRLLATGGVSQVSVIGGEIKEYQILLSPGRMRHYGVSLGEVLESVTQMAGNVAGGALYEYGNEYIVRGVLATENTDELAAAVVRRADGGTVPLSAIATVEAGNRSPKIGTASLKGKPAVVLTVTKQPATSTLALTEQLDRALEELRQQLPADVQVSTDVYRQSRFIESSIGNVRSALIEGGIFVVVVLFLFLMNTRTTLISLVTIPLSLLVAVVVLKVLGLTINTMSLGGMCIAIGSLVDDAIVDVENVFKRLRENRLLPEESRRTTREVIYEASREVRMPILNSTLIIIAAFVPLFFLSGMEGRMLKPLGISFIVALFSSTVVALTLTPVLCSYLLGQRKASDGSERTDREPPVTHWLKKVYVRALSGAIRHRRPLLAGTAVAFIAAAGLFFSLGRSFLPPFNEGSFTVSLSTMPGISLEESDKIGRKAEQILLAIPEIKTTGRKTGRAELDEHALGVNNSEIEAPFELINRTKDELLADIRRQMKDIPGINVEVGAPISHRIDAMLSGTRAGIAIKVFGSDLNKIFALGNRIKEAVSEVEGVEDLSVEQQVERPQLQIVPRRELLKKYGITLPEFAQAIRVLLAGETVSEIYEGNRAFDLVVKTGEAERASIERIRQIPVDAGNTKVPLGQIADVTSTTGPNTINRENVARKIVVSANVSGRALSDVVDDMKSRIAEAVELPEGYHVEYGGQFESEQAASRTLLPASAVALIAIFALLYRQFRDTRQALVVLLSLPLALIGGVTAIALGGGIVNIPAIIGFISLLGIATRSGMLLIARYNDLSAEGLTPAACVSHGSADRLNPILMTALTSALALLPILLGGDQPGNEIQRPMAAVILGGLVTSTLLSIFIVPTLYLRFCRKPQKDTEA